MAPNQDGKQQHMESKNGNPPESRNPDSFWGNIFRQPSNAEEDVITTLRKIPLFTDMTKSELRDFQKIMHRRVFRENEPIFWEGEPGVGMYIVQDGSVGIYKITPDRGKEEMAVLQAGEFFGELALLDESPRSATCISREKSTIIGLFRPDLFNLLEKKPRLGNKFLYKLALVIGERLKATNRELHLLRAKLEQSEIIV
ncbi:MAG: cyclic nucleotide-binding domain-containing protein [candidate division KSB1 bacterium]|nr:cyclic nucleotide-binding domain-containing protein [candidate division KSB1 bacterium]